MASLYYKIFKHHQKKDGTYNVKICLTHKGKQVYYSTPHHASPGQLKRDLSIKDSDLLSDVMADVSRMNDRLKELGSRSKSMDASALLADLTEDRSAAPAPEFIGFCREFLSGLRQDGRDGYAGLLRPVVNSLADFFPDGIRSDELTSAHLRDFERYLSGPRRLVRINQYGDEVATRSDGLSQNGLYTAMNNLRVLFNACRKQCNTEAAVVIPNNPFDYYKMPRRVQVRKRGADLTVTDIITIRDADLSGREAIVRDLFMLSFYMCGMNAKDILEHDWEVSGGRLTYRRAKTRERRHDEAMISIAIPDVAVTLIEKYGGRYLENRYTGYTTFIAAIAKGMKSLGDRLGLPGVTFYHARHTFATLAYNKCGFNKEWIAQALNHTSGQRGVTERYIAADWSAVDKVQAGVLALLAGDDEV